MEEVLFFCKILSVASSLLQQNQNDLGTECMILWAGIDKNALGTPWLLLCTVITVIINITIFVISTVVSNKNRPQYFYKWDYFQYFGTVKYLKTK